MFHGHIFFIDLDIILWFYRMFGILNLRTSLENASFLNRLSLEIIEHTLLLLNSVLVRDLEDESISYHILPSFYCLDVTLQLFFSFFRQQFYNLSTSKYERTMAFTIPPLL